MLHAKLILIDQKCLIIGSANLDYRSLFINHEIVNFIYSDKHIQQMQHWLNALQKNSQLYQPRDNKLYRLVENFSRIFTPLSSPINPTNPTLRLDFTPPNTV